MKQLALSIRPEILLLILGMLAVTYVSRLLPFVLIRAEKIPPRWREVLAHIPHAALGALLVPGFLNGVERNMPASIAGMLAACVVLLLKPNILFAMVAAVATAYIFIVL